MSDLILHQDLESLLQGWMKAEQEGEEFPVPLHDYWFIAGHKKPQDAFALVESRQEEGFEYLRSTLPRENKGKGRPRKALFLTVNAFEKFMASANTRSSYGEELCILDRLQKHIGGQTEVETLAGRIDLLTSEEVIEVKRVKAWKEAIGQVIVYGHYFPSHAKRIHLFGSAHTSFRLMIEKHCKKLKIKVTWET